MSDPALSDSIDAGFSALLVVHLATMLISFGLVALYVVDVFKSSVVGQDKRVMWLIVLLLAGILAMPIYWYLYVWRATPSRPNEARW